MSRSFIGLVIVLLGYKLRNRSLGEYRLYSEISLIIFRIRVLIRHIVPVAFWSYRDTRPRVSIQGELTLGD